MNSLGPPWGVCVEMLEGTLGARRVDARRLLHAMITAGAAPMIGRLLPSMASPANDRILVFEMHLNDSCGSEGAFRACKLEPLQSLGITPSWRDELDR